MLFERSPALDWIQVEVTSHCNAACVYCPCSAYRDNWEKRHMPVETFQALAPALKKAGLVFLQGWGEPLLHPAFYKLLRIAKDAGPRVGTNTNGTLLDQDAIEGLFAVDLDVLAFSLAGVRAEKNDIIRQGTSLDQVRRAIETVRTLRENRKLDRPKIHLAYLLLHPEPEDVERLPEFLCGLGVEEVVISSLTLAVRPEMERELQLAADEGVFDLIKQRLLDVRERAIARGVDVHFQIATPIQPRSGCTENIGRSVFVGADGRVFPCVFAGIPARGENLYYAQGEEHPLQSLSFGNVNSAPLATIWRSRPAAAFRKQFGGKKLWPGCLNCRKRRVESLESPPDLVSAMPWL